MKTIRKFIFAALFATWVSAGWGAEATSVKVHAVLVLASPEGGPSDPKLAAYEPTLRRILRFEGYRFAGEGSANLAAEGKARIGIGRGQTLELETEKSDKQGLSLRVRWLDGERALMNTGLSLRPGVPAVLGGPPTGKNGEVWAIILVADR